MIYCKLFSTIVFLTGVFPIAGIAQPDIPLDKVFKENSESWKVKIRQKGIWGSKPAQVNFGAVKTIGTEAGKGTQSSREVNRELYWKNIKSLKHEETGMELMINDADTVEIRMLTAEEKTIKKHSVLGAMANAGGEENEMYHVSSWIDEMLIQIQSDSATWHYIKLVDGSASAYARLENATDTIEQIFLFRTDNLSGKTTKEIMLTSPALGFVFQYQGIQVAAFQTMMKQTVWISKSVNSRLKAVILATTAALFGTIKSGDSNGF